MPSVHRDPHSTRKTCEICGHEIMTMAFKGLGVCGEIHYKERRKLMEELGDAYVAPVAEPIEHHEDETLDSLPPVSGPSATTSQRISGGGIVW